MWGSGSHLHQIWYRLRRFEGLSRSDHGGPFQIQEYPVSKGAQDAKRAKVFIKLIRELTVAAKNGADPDANPRLRAAIAASKSANMGKDTMERAIARGAGNDDTEQYEEIDTKGMAPKASPSSSRR